MLGEAGQSSQTICARMEAPLGVVCWRYGNFTVPQSGVLDLGFMAKFHCSNWVDGQACKPYFHVHWSKRLVATVIGIGLTLGGPVVTCFNAVSNTPPAGPIAAAVWGWGVLIGSRRASQHRNYTAQ
jgi:hypothetical protein